MYYSKTVLILSIIYILIASMILYFIISILYKKSGNIKEKIIKSFLFTSLLGIKPEICNYNKIIDNLFIGNIFTARDRNFIDDNNITVILNITSELPNYFYYDHKLNYYKLEINDTTDKTDQDIMLNNIHKYVKIIDDNIRLNKNILVHCYAGKSRSATIIAGYLIYKFKMTPNQAMDFIIKKRECAFNNGNRIIFGNVLNKYYELLKKNYYV